MKYAYIDESGTREYQKIMAVSLIVLEGRRTAEKLHEKIMCELYPDYLQRRQRFRRREIQSLPDLHYAQMNPQQKEKVAVRLGSTKLSAFVTYHYHDGSATEHQERFRIYTGLVKEVIRLAVGEHNELSVCVAQQGGWQGYKQALELDLKSLERVETGGKAYRKLDITLEPARRAGIQLADFYAGTCRDYLLNPDDESNLAHYRSIEPQTKLLLTTPEAAI
jgi:hypothetical protein